MSNSEITIPFNMTIPDQSEEDFAEGQKAVGRSFLRRIKLMYGVSDEVLADPPKAKVNEFLLGDHKTNMGRKTFCVPIVYRWHAIFFKNNQLEAESFDQNDDVFKSIIAKAKATKVKDQTAKAGAEWLFWLPEVQAFGTVHFAATAADNAITAFERKKQISLLTSELIGNPKKRQWRVPIVEDMPDDYNVEANGEHLVINGKTLPGPADDNLAEALKQFLAPLQEEEVEDTGRTR